MRAHPSRQVNGARFGAIYCHTQHPIIAEGCATGVLQGVNGRQQYYQAKGAAIWVVDRNLTQGGAQASGHICSQVLHR